MIIKLYLSSKAFKNILRVMTTVNSNHDVILVNKITQTNPSNRSTLMRCDNGGRYQVTLSNHLRATVVVATREALLLSMRWTLNVFYHCCLITCLLWLPQVVKVTNPICQQMELLYFIITHTSYISCAL